MFTSAQRQGILAEARANLAKHEPSGQRVSSRQPEIVYKRRDDAAVGSASAASVASESESWSQWVDRRIENELEQVYEVVGTTLGEYVAQQVAPLKRELALLQREVVQLREQVGLERVLKSLRDEVEAARSEVPKVPALVAQLEKDQAHLKREVRTTREKLKTVKINQTIADYRLAQLDKTTQARASEIEMKIETTVGFAMRELHPAAAATLRGFATESLKSTRRDEKIWIFDPGPTAGAA